MLRGLTTIVILAMINRVEMLKYLDMSSKFDIESQLQKLTFGYEKQLADTGKQHNENRLQNAQHALCMPTQIRQRGCEPLFSPMPLSKPMSLQPLPCVQTGSCPYLSFR